MNSKRLSPKNITCGCGHTAALHDVKGSLRFPIYWSCRSCGCKKFKSAAATKGEKK